MHNLNRSLESRLRNLEREMSTRYVPPTPEEVAAADARREELCRASLDGVPAEALDLDPEERERYEYMLDVAAPAYRGLIAEGSLNPDGTAAGEPAPDDLQGDEEAAWRP